MEYVNKAASSIANLSSSKNDESTSKETKTRLVLRTEFSSEDPVENRQEAEKQVTFARQAFDECEKLNMYKVMSGDDPTKLPGCEEEFQYFKRAFDITADMDAFAMVKAQQENDAREGKGL